VNREDPSGLKWVLRVQASGQSDVEWIDDPNDLAPKENTTYDHDWVAKVQAGKRLSLWGAPPLFEAADTAAREGGTVTIDIPQQVEGKYYEATLRPAIDDWGQAQIDGILADGNGTHLMDAAAVDRIRMAVRQAHVTARGGQGQGALNALNMVSGIAHGMVEVGKGAGQASVQFQNGDIDGLQFATAISNDVATVSSTPLMFMPVDARLYSSHKTCLPCVVVRASTRWWAAPLRPF